MSQTTAFEGRLRGWRAGLVWLVAGACIAVMLVGLIASRPEPDTPAILGAVLVLLVASLGIVGALIGTRRPGNPIGWILWTAAIVLSLGMALETYIALSTTRSGSLPPGTAWLGWLLGLLFTPVIVALLIIVPLLFPDGHLLSRRWRWVVWLGVGVGVAAILPPAFQPGPLEGSARLVNPVGIEAMADLQPILEAVTSAGLAALLALTFICLILRFRRGSGIERQQVKWFAAAVILTGSCFVIAQLPLGPLPVDFWLAWIVTIPLIPIAIGIAILRYRLYEIDRIVSRTLSYAVVTGTLLLVFVGMVLGLQAVLEPVTGENTIAVAGSTLIVAALFQPLRRRVQMIVDRRFNRARYDAQRMVDAFADRLRDDVDISSVSDDLERTIRTSVRPASLELWLRGSAR